MTLSAVAGTSIVLLLDILFLDLVVCLGILLLPFGRPCLGSVPFAVPSPFEATRAARFTLVTFDVAPSVKQS